jgi:hypothetical protein
MKDRDVSGIILRLDIQNLAFWTLYLVCFAQTDERKLGEKSIHYGAIPKCSLHARYRGLGFPAATPDPRRK